MSDEDGKPKKTVSFNEEVKVYVGVEGTGDEEDIEDSEVQEDTNKGKTVVANTFSLLSRKDMTLYCFLFRKY